MTILDKSVAGLTQIVGNAFSQESIDVVSLKEVILMIHGITADKKSYQELYESIGKKLFENGTNLLEYQPNHFAVKNVQVSANGTEDVENDDFTGKLRRLISCCQADFEVLNRFMILRFGESSKKTSYLLVHDTHSKPHVFTKVKTSFNDECKVFEVSAFLDELTNSRIDKTENYIMLLVLSFNPNADETILKNLKDISGFLSPVTQIILFDDCTKDNFYKTESNYLKIENEIKYLVSKELKDLDLNNELEKIIKKLFSYNLSTSLQYKKMTKGFSGSAVLYVRPVGDSHTQVRYVVKIGSSPSSIAKIQEEIRNFNTYVDSYSTSYAIKIEETEKSIAIRYTYASKDGKIDAESFSEIYDKRPNLKDIINLLFEKNALFNEWKETKSLETITFEKDYKNYINRGEIIKTIAKIQDVTVEETEKSHLVKIFDKICECEIDSYKKICHGDLHSDNFFVDDENNVFLIDFGDTAIRHTLIDYTTLECSIKFKHIPDYIENGKLFGIERELLELESFKPGFNFKNIDRSDLTKPYHLILAIRSEAFNGQMIKNKGSQLEYLYSLFMITFRQIRYPTINQLYAIKSAELVGTKVLEIIGVSIDEIKAELESL